jgi:hypothetical protein
MIQRLMQLGVNSLGNHARMRQLDCLIYARIWQAATQIIPIPARKIGNHRGHGCSVSNSIVAPVA